MLFTLTLFIALFVATLVLMLGSGLLGTLVSLRMSAEGVATSVIGLVMSGFYVGLILGSFTCPKIVRRAGHIRAFAAFAAINTATTLLYPLFIAPAVWFLLRVSTGLSMMGQYMVVESWLNDRTEPRMRGRVFSVYMSLTFLGLGFAQLFLKVADIGGSDLFLIAGIFFALCLVPVTLTRSIHPSLPETGALKLGHLFRRAPLGLLGSLTTGAVAGAFFGLAPVFALRSGLDIHTVAAFMGVTIFSGLLLQWPVGMLSDRMDRRLVLACLSVLVSLASLLIILATSRFRGLLLPFAALYGGLAFTLYPVSVAHTNDRIENFEIVSASTALILCYGLGACLGPLAASGLMAWLGPPGLYGFIALCTGCFGVMTALFRLLEKPKPEEAVPYIPVPRTSPVITAIHPYSEAEPEDEEAASP
jgi:MFS family permease